MHWLGCVKTTEIPYSDIGNFAFTNTSMSIGQHRAHNFVREPLLIERSGKVHRLGHYRTDDSAQRAAAEMKAYIFDRGSSASTTQQQLSRFGIHGAEFVNPSDLPDSGSCC